MTRNVRVLVILVIMFGCVGCDQTTKAIVREQLHVGVTISLLHGALLLEPTENVGAFLSVGASLPQHLREALFAVGGSVLVALGVLWMLASRKMSLVQTAGAAFACGGGLGNVIDRVTHDGHVIDFLNVGGGPIRTGIFNIADMALMLGLALLLVSSVRGESRGRAHQGDL